MHNYSKNISTYLKVYNAFLVPENDKAICQKQIEIGEGINLLFKKEVDCAKNGIKSLCPMTDTLDKNLHMCWEHDAIRNSSQVRSF